MREERGVRGVRGGRLRWGRSPAVEVDQVRGGKKRDTGQLWRLLRWAVGGVGELLRPSVGTRANNY